MSTHTPHNFEGADIVLRTPLSKGFRVHRAVLYVESPVFETLASEVPILLDELDILLHLIYPIAIPGPSYLRNSAPSIRISISDLKKPDVFIDLLCTDYYASISASSPSRLLLPHNLPTVE